MDMHGGVFWIVVALISGKGLVAFWLDELNRRYVLAHAGAIPEAFKGVMDPDTYARSVAYTLARTRFDQVEILFDSLVLLVVLGSGVLPWVYRTFEHAVGHSAASGAAFLVLISMAFSILSLPLAWHYQFHLEQRFGFNTTKLGLWWQDRLKAAALGVVLGFPLLWLVLKLVDWTGSWWWLWAWGSLLAFQFLLSILAPVLILPLFNKFTPLPESSLRERLFGLAQRCRFRARSIQVMDGSKRSRHSNAFFIGFGGFRKIVLFDTLMQQLGEEELEAVLAHEIGHFKKKHIPKTLILTALSSLAGFWILSLLLNQDWLYRSFGFPVGHMTVAMLLFGLLSGLFTFWFSPVAHWWSRRNEYEADAFAAQIMSGGASLVGALRKLNEKNLSNLTPHPVYSAFYYSHPTLLEREQALTHTR